MAIEIKVPTVGESINEVTLVKWLKKDGEYANRDEVIAELESEKATFELNAEQAGTIKIIAAEGDTLKIGDIVCSIDTDAIDNGQWAMGNEQLAMSNEQSAMSNEQLAMSNQQWAMSNEQLAMSKEQKVVPKSEIRNLKSEIETKATPVAAAIIADKKVDVKTVTATCAKPSAAAW
jgi:2-oxoglutarate dehydrogenase E2 component (dihydrolipoamide succinyltransferase)